MAVPFKKPFNWSFNPDAEICAIRKYRDNKAGRAIPQKSPHKLLIATWNIANLGVQERDKDCLKVISEMISWFDVIAIQEVNENLSAFQDLLKLMKPSYKAVFSDRGGNNERAAFLFNTNKLELGAMAGEVAIPPAQHRNVKYGKIRCAFTGFDRNPYIVSFISGKFTFILVNVHLYYGSNHPCDMNRRALEAYAIARWTDLRRKSKNPYTTNIIALGDFNLPKYKSRDPIQRSLTSRGLIRPEHSTRIASSIATDAEYDQIMFFPGKIEEKLTGNSGVFDFDGGIFEKLWRDKGEDSFKKYVKWAISDHRPMWVELST